MKLYEIQNEYLQHLDLFTDPEADIPAQAAIDTLEAIEGDFDAKAVQVAAFAKQMEAEAEAIKAAVEKMEKRRKTLEGRAKWLRDYVKIGMEVIGHKKIAAPWFVLSIQKNPASVEVFDEAAIPAEYKTPVTEFRLNKVAIKDALTAGREIPGVKLANGTRLSIR